jgi:hypothetical protein
MQLAEPKGFAVANTTAEAPVSGLLLLIVEVGYAAALATPTFAVQAIFSLAMGRKPGNRNAGFRKTQ